MSLDIYMVVTVVLYIYGCFVFYVCICICVFCLLLYGRMALPNIGAKIKINQSYKTNRVIYRSMLLHYPSLVSTFFRFCIAIGGEKRSGVTPIPFWFWLVPRILGC